ncbi:SDR family NAD(P)-dependent oxidoreductase [Capnocytophaga cynodegmi]|uniref:Oxidoreductase, short chain dehydrogenase/reductase family protein n=1 Tax=Capnocytophaga cynodegmi TaxID=28189 RepID=A0A0B7H515_9FLAO|nr:SDR family oxidoreductase [Capnocytophaga cynodegmi]CEN34681.1 Oxidoreductase, short chain dehydrogenase/reductase family protein [Capnocytophaga cynodegmi]
MKNVIITGTSRGIGLELAKQFANSGHKVLALSRNTQPLKDFNNKNIDFFPFDITSEEDLRQVFRFLSEKWKRVDVLINNAGKLINKPFEMLTREDFSQVYDVNIFGVARLIQTVIPFMSKGSHVVTISSMGGIQGSMKFTGLAAYSSSKGAIITLSELLAEEYKEKGIVFNTLALGAVQTEMLSEAFPEYKANTSPESMAKYIFDFALNANELFNGKVIQVSNSTP